MEHSHQAVPAILQQKKIGQTVANCLIFVVSLAGNAAIGIIVYKAKTMRKPINFFIVNMAMSDLLMPIFLIPLDIQLLYTNSWLIGGPLDQALCKLVIFLSVVSIVLSIQSLVLIAVGRFGAVVYPLRSPRISSKLCPFFILVTWIAQDSFMASKDPTGLAMELNYFFTSVGSITAQKARDLSSHHGLNVNLDVPTPFHTSSNVGQEFLCSTKSQKIR